LAYALRVAKVRGMHRLMAVLLVLAALGALFGPRRLRAVFWAVAAVALLYTSLRLLGVLEGPRPYGLG
jgi:hypothetical protein